jgi:protein CpxP
MKKLITNSLVSIGIAAAAPLAIAQTPGELAQTREARHAERHQRADRAFALPSERVEARLAYIRTALKITDAQQPQWDAFANVLRKHAKDAEARIQKRREMHAQHGGVEHAERTRPTAIERMERRQQILASASTRLNEVLEAGKPLYAALSPEQQQIADRLLASRGEGRFRHGNRMRGRA